MEARRSNSFDASAAFDRCKHYRRRVLDVSQKVGALHVAPAFSCTEIVDSIYNHLMSGNGTVAGEDIFLMSKGHACILQYIILAECGVLTEEDLDRYCTPDGRLGTHPDYGTPGVAAATGSLGHGMGIAAGIAKAEQLLNRGSTTFLLLSDGECQEGSTWEAAMTAANLGLDNLVAFVDYNDFSGLERMSEGHKAFHPLADKFRSFGWDVEEVDGHNSSEIVRAVEARSGSKPFIAVCQTVKGKGVSYMENVPIWHYRSPNPEEYAQAIREIESTTL
ncbi:transketolase [Nisaea sediminum]|uniref:transketolase n=1 Tax=Nisaea sediminum TaxID=2775867 RepID=UPI001867C16C|nr:transketolase [Nisaea sediminum]